MTSIACYECAEQFHLGAANWLTLTSKGRNRTFCSTSCLLAWLNAGGAA